MADRVSMFSTGSQFADWTAKNCEHCRKATDQYKTRCDIEVALWSAYMDDGKVPSEIARRAGYDPPPGKVGYYCWPCGELESTTPEHAEQAQQWRKQHQPAPLVTHHTEDGQIVITRGASGT